MFVNEQHTNFYNKYGQSQTYNNYTILGVKKCDNKQLQGLCCCCFVAVLEITTHHYQCCYMY